MISSAGGKVCEGSCSIPMLRSTSLYAALKDMAHSCHSYIILQIQVKFWVKFAEFGACFCRRCSLSDDDRSSWIEKMVPQQWPHFKTFAYLHRVSTSGLLKTLPVTPIHSAPIGHLLKHHCIQACTKGYYPKKNDTPPGDCRNLLRLPACSIRPSIQTCGVVFWNLMVPWAPFPSTCATNDKASPTNK